jgi:hypothetical protein
LSLKFCLRVVASRFGDRDSWKKIGAKKRDRWEGHSSHNSIELVVHLVVFGPTQRQTNCSVRLHRRDDRSHSSSGWITQNMNCLRSRGNPPFFLS